MITPFRRCLLTQVITLVLSAGCGEIQEPQSRGEPLWTLSMRIGSISGGIDTDHLRLAFVWLIPDEINEALGRIEVAEDIEPTQGGLLTFTLPLFALPPENALSCEEVDPLLGPNELPQQTCLSDTDCESDSYCWYGYCQSGFVLTPCQSSQDCQEENCDLDPDCLGESTEARDWEHVCHHGFCQRSYPADFHSCFAFGRFLIYEDRNQNGQLDPVYDPTQEALDYVWGPNTPFFLAYVESNSVQLDNYQPGLQYAIAEDFLSLETITDFRPVDEVLDIDLRENPDLQLLMCYEYNIENDGPLPDWQNPDEVILPGPICESTEVPPSQACGPTNEPEGCVEVFCSEDTPAFAWFWNCSTTYSTCERVTNWESAGDVFLFPWDTVPEDWPCD